MNLQYNPDHYGKSSGDEYAMIKDQLEKSGLFKVNLQSTEWVTYSKASRADEYPLFQFGWFPDFSDADNYLTPFFPEGGFLKNHYNNPTVNDLISKQLTTVDKTERESTIKDAQNALAKDISTLPLLQGAQVAISGSGVKGVDSTLDASFKFRLGTVSRVGLQPCCSDQPARRGALEAPRLCWSLPHPAVHAGRPMAAKVQI